NHAITVSHAGHVTLGTGNYLRTHGIVDAAFYEKDGDTLKFTDAFADSNYSIAGTPAVKSISEKKVLTPGIAEWIKKKDPASKVFCVGTGEISSALYCFHPGEDVYWYNVDFGKYVTSTYFKTEVPAWISDFNKKELPEFFKMSKEWNNIVPQQYLGLANADDADFENGGRKHVFPYAASAKAQKENRYNSWFRFPPFCDNATLALAKQGIASLHMGQGITTDYLSIVLSQVDNTNHGFGPSSLETFNVLLQMDIALGDFYDYLDKTVGKENYVVALSADHGFPQIPEQTLKKGKWAKRLGEKQIEAVLAKVKHIAGSLKANGNDAITGGVKSFLLKQDFIADVYTAGQLNDESMSSDKFLELYKKSYRRDRVPRLPFFR
ncbi:MAG: alkaline phosphatase family protein, partial [Mucilaginibacter sp.]